MEKRFSTRVTAHQERKGVHLLKQIVQKFELGEWKDLESLARAEVPTGQVRASAGLGSSFHWPEVK